MAAENWLYSARVILTREGGFVNDPNDPGGATNMGITIGTLSDALGRRATVEDVKNLTEGAALKIYRDRYWDKVRADKLPIGVDLAVFDAAVMHGPAKAAMLLQSALGVADDGIVGPITIAAAQEADPGKVIRHMQKARIAFMQRLSTWEHYKVGWPRRVNAVTETALVMIPALVPEEVTPAPSPGWLATLVALIRGVQR